jgi:Pyruvate/2-oxoacid:ferredoxin oxidoreductase gamma subunit
MKISRDWMGADFNIVLVGTGGQGVILSSNILGQTALKSDPSNKVRTAETHGMAQRGGTVIVHLRFGPYVESPLVKINSADALLSFELIEAIRYKDYIKPNGILLVNDEIIIPPILFRGQHMEINPNVCVGCGNCRINCVINNYSQNPDSSIILNSPASRILNGTCEILSGCTACEACLEICRRNAIQVIKEITYPPHAEIMQAIKALTNNGFVIPASKIARELGDIRMSNTVMIGALFGFENVPLEFERVQEVISNILPPKVVNMNLKALEAGQKLITGFLKNQ